MKDIIKETINIFKKRFNIFLYVFNLSLVYSLSLLFINIILFFNIFSINLINYNNIFLNLLSVPMIILFCILVLIYIICNLFLGSAIMGSYYRSFNNYSITNTTFLSDGKKYFLKYCVYILLISFITIFLNLLYFNSCYFVLPICYTIMINKLFYNEKISKKIYYLDILLGFILVISGFISNILPNILLIFLPFILFCSINTKTLKNK